MTRLCSKSIHSDDVNGIRLITIHKSKGLEMDNVIIPYCDWAIEDIRDLMWVEPKVKPFNEPAFGSSQFAVSPTEEVYLLQ